MGARHGTCDHTLTVAGSYTPELTINCVQLAYISSIAVSPGVIDGPSCTISSGSSNGSAISAGAHEQITIQPNHGTSSGTH